MQKNLGTKYKKNFFSILSFGQKSRALTIFKIRYEWIVICVRMEWIGLAARCVLYADTALATKCSQRQGGGIGASECGAMTVWPAGWIIHQ